MFFEQKTFNNIFFQQLRLRSRHDDDDIDFDDDDDDDDVDSCSNNSSSTFSDGSDSDQRTSMLSAVTQTSSSQHHVTPSVTPSVVAVTPNNVPTQKSGMTSFQS
jgi:hypothetical protein